MLSAGCVGFLDSHRFDSCPLFRLPVCMAMWAATLAVTQGGSESGKVDGQTLRTNADAPISVGPTMSWDLESAMRLCHAFGS